MATSLTANLILQKTKLDNLRHVRRLNVCGAQVSHIHVLRDAINAEVLSLSVNHIEDLSPLSFLQELRELYLRKNSVGDLMQVLHLSQLEQLEVLGLSENPISADPSYRPFVIAAIPSLCKLDDLEITPTERREAEAEFSEIRHWAPPDPIPVSHIGTGGAPPSSNGSPNRPERDPFANTYSNGAQTARRHGHASRPSGADVEDPFARVPATARRPSGALPQQQQQQQQQYFHNGHDDGSVSGGWDDTPVGGGGGGARARRPQAAAATASVAVAPQQQQRGDAMAGSSSSRPPHLNLAAARTHHKDPFAGSEVFAPGAASERPPSPSRMHRAVTPPSRQHQHQQQQHGGDRDRDRAHHAAAPTAWAPPSPLAVEEGILRAIKALVDQLSPQGAAEVQRYAANRR